MVPRQFLAGLFLVLFAGLAAVSATFFWDIRAELRKQRDVERNNRLVLDAKMKELAAQEVRLQRLRTDPAYVEKEIRRLTGYARQGELVFRFDSAEP